MCLLKHFQDTLRTREAQLRGTATQKNGFSLQLHRPIIHGLQKVTSRLQPASTILSFSQQPRSNLVARLRGFLFHRLAGVIVSLTSEAIIFKIDPHTPRTLVVGQLGRKKRSLHNRLGHPTSRRQR